MGMTPGRPFARSPGWEPFMAQKGGPGGPKWVKKSKNSKYLQIGGTSMGTHNRPI